MTCPARVGAQASFDLPNVGDRAWALDLPSAGDRAWAFDLRSAGDRAWAFVPCPVQGTECQAVESDTGGQILTGPRTSNVPEQVI